MDTNTLYLHHPSFKNIPWTLPMYQDPHWTASHNYIVSPSEYYIILWLIDEINSDFFFF